MRLEVWLPVEKLKTLPVVRTLTSSGCLVRTLAKGWRVCYANVYAYVFQMEPKNARTASQIGCPESCVRNQISCSPGTPSRARTRPQPDRGPFQGGTPGPVPRRGWGPCCRRPADSTCPRRATAPEQSSWTSAPTSHRALASVLFFQGVMLRITMNLELFLLPSLLLFARSVTCIGALFHAQSQYAQSLSAQWFAARKG